MTTFQHPRHSFTALKQTFVVDSAYEFGKPLGQGAYGSVVSAKHIASGDGVAIKKITNINSKKILIKRCLREVKLLHHFRGHKNITCLYDMDIVFDATGNFHEVYLYEELMETDLHTVIKFGDPLSDAHIQYIIYQALCGLKYIHSAKVLHRDIKPGNLLVDTDTSLKICDFGLARNAAASATAADNAMPLMTEYVATRWYRAPEIMLSFSSYTAAIDVWSLGCVFAEMIGRKPLFQGRDYVDQLNQILNTLGTPSEEVLKRLGSLRIKPKAQEYIRSLPRKAPISFSQLYPHANPLALDLISKMLTFDPAQRISCEQALAHPYLAVWRNPYDEPVHKSKFDFSFEEEDSIDGMKALIVEEVAAFRKIVRTQAKTTQRRRQDSLPFPSRDDIMASTPIAERDRGRSFFPDSPTLEEMHDPSDLLEQELVSRGGVVV